MRRTGRTSRMIEAAKAAAASGRAVYIIAASEKEARRIEGLVGEPRNGIQVESYASAERCGFVWGTLRFQMAHPNCLHFVDHYAIETKYRHILDEMTRYDKGAPDAE